MFMTSIGICDMVLEGYKLGGSQDKISDILFEFRYRVYKIIKKHAKSFPRALYSSYSP